MTVCLAWSRSCWLRAGELAEGVDGEDVEAVAEASGASVAAVGSEAVALSDIFFFDCLSTVRVTSTVTVTDCGRIEETD